MAKLIGIISCHKEAAHRQAIRETWATEIPTGWDLKFFLGGSAWIPETDPEVIEFMGPPGTLASMHPTKAATSPSDKVGPADDEVILDVPDSYLGTAWKGRAIQRWAFERGYDGLFLGMCDTFVFPRQLKMVCTGDCAAQVFKAAPAKAYPIAGIDCPHGGFGYWLSKRALEALSREPVYHYSEDQSTAFALHHAGIKITANRLFSNNRLLGGYFVVGNVSQHLSTKHDEFTPQQIRDTWRRSKEVFNRWPDWDGMCRKCGCAQFRSDIYGPRCLKCGDRWPMRPK
jgi:hypothetical protein